MVNLTHKNPASQKAQTTSDELHRNLGDRYQRFLKRNKSLESDEHKDLLDRFKKKAPRPNSDGSN